MNYSDWTETKNAVVGGIFTWLIAASKSIMQRYPRYSTYQYIDMNAADGSGSPALFLDAVRQANIPYRALFVEHEKMKYASLYARYGSFPSVQTYRGDHNAAVPHHCRHIYGKPYGLIYNDPCGIPSFDTLATVSQLPQIDHIDMLINCPATAIKRARGAFHRAQYLVDGLDGIQKRHWLIRAPHGRWQWTILLGTNWGKVQEWRAQQMYLVQSPEGQDILRRLNLTSEEQELDNGQTTLPFL